MSIRTIRRRRANSAPAFVENKQVQAIEKVVADQMAENFGETPRIFVTPYYDATEAKAINAKIPEAEFYGTSWTRTIAENIAELPDQKTIYMTTGTIPDVATRFWGMFDGAWINYTTFYGYKEVSPVEDVIHFYDRCMKSDKVIFAVTMKGTNPSDITAKLTEGFQSRQKAKAVELTHSASYMIGNDDMITLVFRINGDAEIN